MNSLARLIEPALEAIEPMLNSAERARATEERKILATLKGDDPLALAERVAAKVSKPFFKTSEEAVMRMHELAGQGARASCRSSLPIVEAFLDAGLHPKEKDGPILVVGRGHVAPAFLAARHVRSQLPFIVLAALHRGVPGVISQEWGFANTMRSCLGVGVAQAVSRAWWEKKAASGRTVVCFSGDGELQEGLCFESLRLVRDLKLENFVLVVDANGFGIEPLTGPTNVNWLKGVFRRVRVVDGTSKDEIGKVLEEMIASRGPAAMIVATRKPEGHSYRFGSAPLTLAKKAGKILAGLTARVGGNMQIVTADMAGRFGLAGNVPYLNVGLSESGAVGMLMSLPDETIKVVVTDDKYLLDSMNILSELAASAKRLVILAGQSWSVWGGAPTALNMLALIPGARVFQPVSEKSLKSIFELVWTNSCRPEDSLRPLVVSLIDAPETEGLDDSDSGLTGQTPEAARWIQLPPRFDPKAPIAISFGIAGAAVQDAAALIGLGHLHCSAMDPDLDSETMTRLKRADHVISFEAGAVRGGFGERLSARYGLNVHCRGAEAKILHFEHEEQMKRFGLDANSILKTLEEAWNRRYTYMTLASGS